MKKIFLIGVLIIAALSRCQVEINRNDSPGASIGITTSSDSYSKYDPNTKKHPMDTSENQKVGTSVMIPENPLFLEMLKKFQTSYPNAVLTKFEWTSTSNRIEIEGEDQKKEYYLLLDQNAKVISDSSEINDDPFWEEDKIEFSEIISLSDAIKIAQTEVNSTVLSAELSKDDGQTHWEVKFHQGNEVVLHASTGEILVSEFDD
ncbi:hypothetical protein IGI96_003533 [Enterococcus sp. DIV0421]|uniref:PepSY domain-containing protein n=1 Tax=Enterococcus sp. DIV0421 TaxID=2774688 RepID=UPI003F2329A5